MNVDSELQVVYERLKEARKRAGLTQLELSLQSGVSQNMIAYKKKKKRSPALKTVLKLCNALGVKLSDLLPEENGASDTTRKQIKAEILSLLEKL